MEATTREISNIFEWLENHKRVTVNDEWLEACISWWKSRGTTNGNLYMQLKNDVYEQWLMSDLGESGTNCLPDQISSVAKTFTHGLIALQVNSIVNVGESAYSQMKKLIKNESPDTDIDNNDKLWQPKPCRMLMLELTDGKQTIQGMEYQPMRKLNLGLTPGTKVFIKANTLCRSGMLFLTDDNIEILGGKVQSLSEENSQINILQRLVTSAKEGGNDEVIQIDGNYNEGFQNNNAPRPYHSSLEDDLLAELDGNMNQNEVNAQSTAQPQISLQHFNDMDDDISDDVLNRLTDIENKARQECVEIPDDVPDDVLVRSMDESVIQWQFDYDGDDDDFL